MVHVMLFSMLSILFLYISTFRSMLAVLNMAVFCSSLISRFADVLLRYFVNDFGMVPVDPIVTSIVFVCTFHMRCIFIARYSYVRTFSASFLTTFLSPEIATSISTHVPFFIITDYDAQFIVREDSVGFHSLIT